MPPAPSFGLSLSKKPTLGNASQKRKKAIFDSDSDNENENESRSGANETEITTIGGLDDTSNITKAKASGETDTRPAKRKIVPLGQAPKPKIKPLSKASIFADEDDEDTNAKAKADASGGEKLNSDGKTTYGLNDPSKSANPAFTNLSALHSSKKHAAEAQDLDPSIYSYDAVYESLHSKPAKKDQTTAEGETVPKYMTNLLRSAEIRKRDQLRARDRLLAKEREAEGEEFDDKEKFVTSAYKAQQEELRRVEEEEKKREEEEAERKRKNGGSGMVGFYRDLLKRGEEQHEAVMKATDEAAKKIQEGAGGEETVEKTEEEKKSEAQMAAELNAKGAHIAVNDDGQVVDKRQLLSAGLNVAPKPKTAAPPPARTKPGAGAGAKSYLDSRQGGGRAGQRARQTEMIAQQLEEQERQRQEEEAAKQKEIAERSRSQKSATEVSSARERYLARKKEREAAAKGS
ncbi:coiled-coil domain-containing protein 55-domain containing protein [Aspergillus karnatakaensis]|uniref:splicing regulator NSRP1-like domain-containing protein n=1 Tax=Aspergillus karnatakaensis TaxID=1810916 RepID=UPI003CCD36C2